MIKRLENFIKENKKKIENLNIEVFQNTHEDTACCDFISKKRIGRIVVWSDYRIELEILDTTSELQVFFKYYQFNNNNFDESIFSNFLDELKK